MPRTEQDAGKSAGRRAAGVRQAALLVVTALVATACTASSEGKEAKAAASSKPTAISVSEWLCENGQLHWGKIRTEGKLVAVSQLVRIEKGEQAASVTFQAIPVREMTAGIESSAKVSEELVFASLEQQMNLGGKPLAQNGESVPLPDDGFGTANMTGKTGDYLSAIGVQAVEASFVQGCVGDAKAPVYGTVTTWYGKTQGLIKCGRNPGTYPGFREAHDMVCGEAEKGEG
ncbi:hypothetical protein [Streptomyces fulvoviolaceus]|uniref:hypothetical protein n=1 Tax=Streptomyces fulvoviolaceus TaxID=285535 RepID=UPI0021BEB1A3|nr:hypothetical protein [Streptomyces fulvoviolaceus]MCT9076985.1 hypothetical protein [Streptomyces fulvoviolaceus]